MSNATNAGAPVKNNRARDFKDMQIDHLIMLCIEKEKLSQQLAKVCEMLEGQLFAAINKNPSRRER